MNAKYVLGFLFIMLAGLIYTIERAASAIAGNVELAGFWAGGITGQVPVPETAGFFENPFAPLFVVAGALLLFFGWYEDRGK